MSIPDPTTRRSILALSLIGSFGVNSMYGLVYRNGYIDALLRLREYGPHVLPGSNIPILTRFTGIGLLDKALVLAGVMFANITDGSAPQLSLYGFQFAGQLVPLYTVLMIEAARRGNKGNIMSLAVLWGCATQGLGYGFTMPIYAIVHLLCSPTAASMAPAVAQKIRLQSTDLLEGLVPSMILGYIIPTVLMAIPFRSHVLHQWLGGLWQGYPVWVSLIHYGIKVVRSRRANKSNEPKPPDTTTANGTGTRSYAARIDEEMTLHRAYLFAFAVSASTNITTFSILASCKLFPSLFPSHILTALTLKSVFIPPPFWSRAPMPNMAVGILNFFQYDQYVGSTAAIVWAVALRIKARKQAMSLESWLWLAGEIFGIAFVAGPGAALVSLVWNRDEMVLNDDKLFETVEAPAAVDVESRALIDADSEDPNHSS
ncbi:uncharacterized protein K444DRAFT_668381 [Hyaloscypha bicolor E]|uniref:Uncharacterized protein n=1 Tax=Hyaloscypha bicolor E TaxID=1095630 RepID=A0A2J6SPK6_9HELO|nr:uncharacterized protein K444DRAFT_668381 [Hyaloscypha bicolor E]PMD52696.1 hypothetical protein K444DRAFT_668381 [Hyaloscypha bicolor E]